MRYDDDSAWMVELVLREMFRKGYRTERTMLIRYYPNGMTTDSLCEMIGVSRRTVGRRRKVAEKVFSEQWADFIRK